MDDFLTHDFYALRAEKQNHIIDAALMVFGRNGYKKASIADIAEEAGIAKGMVMYYFGSKKNLYLYLAEFSIKLMVEEMEKKFDKSVTDFFDKLKMITDIKVSVMRKHPAIISFLSSFYYETHKDVREEVKQFIKHSEKIRERWVFDGADVSRFKEGINPGLLEKLLIWSGKGMAEDISSNRILEHIDAYIKDYNDCLDMIKKHFYKD